MTLFSDCKHQGQLTFLTTVASWAPRLLHLSAILTYRWHPVSLQSLHESTKIIYTTMCLCSIKQLLTCMCLQSLASSCILYHMCNRAWLPCCSESAKTGKSSAPTCALAGLRTYSWLKLNTHSHHQHKYCKTSYHGISKNVSCRGPLQATGRHAGFANLNYAVLQRC